MSARRLGGGAAFAEIAFRFDGREYSGREGDTIASALLANDVRIVGRSFKYHRPRGVFGAGVEEPNAIFDVTRDGLTTPNVLATTAPLVEGLDIRAGNASPTAAHDRGGVLDRFARFLPAGFYYKTFLWPNWAAYEPRIRAFAGLGRLDPLNAPPAQSPQIDARCDVLVIGGGPAGLAAARAAAQAGKRVALVHDQHEAGGSLLVREATVDGLSGADWSSTIQRELVAAGHRVLVNAIAYGIYHHNLVCVWERRRGRADALWRIRAENIVVAAGAIERPLVFPDNDRPGVMSVEAALVYLRRHEVLVGQRVVVATNNDRAYGVARALRQAGARVTIADTRRLARATAGDVDIRRGISVAAVHGARGVEAVSLDDQRIEADCLLVSGGLTPTIHLYAQAQGRLRYDERLACFAPGAALDRFEVVGAANGTFDLAPALAEGHAAGGGTGEPPRAGGALETYAIEPAWPKPGAHARQWVDYQNDVTLKDIELAARENFRSVEHLKRYTTLGMATDQGKTSNLNGLAALAALTGRTIQETGTTTYRPPFVPTPFSIIAGRRRGELFNPVRRLALEPQHRSAQATFREYGGWLRPAFFGPGEAQPAIQREARIAREAVGLLDASPLGKIEVFGSEAGALMDFNFYSVISTLKPGRIRYAFMLTESGIVYDDGVVAKLADDHYIVSCSSGHVQGVTMRLEEWRQDRFDRAKVTIHNATPQWATLTLSGPRARALVEKLDLEIDGSDAALPHMSFASCVFEGECARIARVSFTGDRSYEISVSARNAPALFGRMSALVEAFGGCLMGSEALLLLRAEKGYLIAGKDTDGATHPGDLGINGPRDKRRDEYVGKRSLFTDNALRDDRPQFVGLTVEGGEPLPTGAHAIERNGSGRRSVGFVTSSYFSPTLDRPIALGLIERGLSRIGETIDLVHLDATYHATIAAPCALDPGGARLRV